MQSQKIPFDWSRSPLKVLQPARLGTLELHNRLIVPPMATYLATPDGFVTDELIAYARARAEGGFGLYVLEATCVDPLGRGFSRGTGIENNDKIPGLRRLVRAVHDAGGKISVQLHHAGRETSSAITGHTVVAPSDCPVVYSEEKVHELTIPEIERIVQSFADAAERAAEAGFDAVMLHGAHGYLLSQFLSPYTNKRTDAYGGSLQNRLKISLDIITAIRRRLGTELPLSYRMSVNEGIPGGLTVQESAQAAAILSTSGIDDMHIVAGNYATHALIIPPAFRGDMVNLPLVQAVRDAVGNDFPLTMAGRITNIFQAEELVQENLVQFVAMGRASLADPQLPLRCARGDHASVRSCLGCNDACIGRTGKELSIGCAVNPLTGREREFEHLAPPSRRKKILVAGGGPAGMEAAWLAAERGHEIILCERERHLGGQFRLAAFPPHKNSIFSYLAHMRVRLEQAGVQIRLSCRVDEEVLRRERPEHVLLATGGVPLVIPFPGLEGIHHVTAQDVLDHALGTLGKHVAVIGGGLVGCETAEFIADTGRKVHVIEMQETLIPDLFPTVREHLLSTLAECGVILHMASKVSHIEQGCIAVQKKDLSEERIGPVDSVVLALGVRPEKSLEETLRNLSIPYTALGDCIAQGNCRHATQTALAALNI